MEQDDPHAERHARVSALFSEARRLEDDDAAGPKYVNSPEGELFHKGRLIYGLDRALDTVRKGGHLILVEGYKDIKFPKIELHRAELGKPYLYPGDDTVIALACDDNPPQGIEIPVLDINDIEAISDFIHENFNLPE